MTTAHNAPGRPLNGPRIDFSAPRAPTPLPTPSNSSLTLSERERAAYLAGNADLAGALAELGEALDRIDALESEAEILLDRISSLHDELDALKAEPNEGD